MDRVHVCQFSALNDIPARKRGDLRTVLSVLDKAKRFSCFEVTEHAALAGSVDALIKRGLITTDNERHGYPWTAVELTDAGRRFLASEGKEG